MLYLMSISDLRKTARARERAAKQKITRNANNGIFLSKSRHDPLRPATDVSTMNSRQLKSYINKLNAFVDRRNQYDSGLNGEPLSRKLVRQYKGLEAQRNANTSKHMSGMRDVMIEPLGMTVGQREDNIVASNFNILRAGGNPQYRPYDVVNRSISGIPNEDALIKLIRHTEKQVGEKYARRAVIAQRRNHIKFLESHGALDQAKLVKKLSVRQYDILQNYTNYGNLNEFRYIGGDGSAGSTARLDKIADDATDDIDELIRWAQKQ